MRRAEDGLGIADATRTHMYRKWLIKESRKYWEAVQQHPAAWTVYDLLYTTVMEFDPLPQPYL
jgi:hypothetical protein